MRRTQKMSFIVLTIVMILLAAVFLPMTEFIILVAMIFFTFFDYQKHQCINDNTEATEPLS